MIRLPPTRIHLAPLLMDIPYSDLSIGRRPTLVKTYQISISPRIQVYPRAVAG